jgi:hypothetical protein
MPLRGEWAPEPKPAIPELADDYKAYKWDDQPLSRGWLVPVEQKISEASFAALRELMHGGIGEPEVTETWRIYCPDCGLFWASTEFHPRGIILKCSDC